LESYTPLKYVISGKPLIAPEPEVGKFQNWPEMKVNYPTNKENTPEDFSDNFRNIKNFVQVDHFKKITKNRLIFPFFRSRKTAGGRKTFKTSKINHILMSDYRVKISGNSDHHALQNLSSNTDARK
jgi:hypothetical protein